MAVHKTTSHHVISYKLIKKMNKQTTKDYDNIITKGSSEMIDD